MLLGCLIKGRAKVDKQAYWKRFVCKRLFSKDRYTD